jgi:PIN domain nuclease of toxin-antitoxin system
MGGLGVAEVILLDTHVLVWMVTEPKRLSRAADREIRKAQHDRSCAISSITLWELALLFRGNRLRGTGSIENSIRTILDDTGVKVLEITPEIADLSTSFPETYPKDPRGPIDRRHCACLWAESYHAGRENSVQSVDPNGLVAEGYRMDPQVSNDRFTHSSSPACTRRISPKSDQYLSSAGNTA